MEEKETKTCPYCGETILATAKKCRYCGEWLDGDAVQRMEKKHPNSSTTIHKTFVLLKAKKVWLSAISISILLICVFIGVNLYRYYKYPTISKEFKLTSYELFLASSYLTDDYAKIWQEFIFDEKIYMNLNTGKFGKWPYSSDEVKCSSFSDALEKKVGFNRDYGMFAYIDSLYKLNKKQLGKLSSPSSSYKEEYKTLLNMFQYSDRLYRLAKYPEGSLREFSTNVNDIESNYKTCLSQSNIELASIEDSLSSISMKTLANAEIKIKEAKREKYANKIVENEKWLKDNAKEPGVITDPSGIQYSIIREGTGQKPLEASTVKVHYEGRLINGTVFDSSIKRESPVELRVNTLIKGLVKALTQMNEGSIWEIYIPAELAYEDRQTDMIEPYSTLIFKVELIEVKK